jgi:hypothetical protein
MGHDWSLFGMSSHSEAMRVLISTFNPSHTRKAGDELYSGSLFDSLNRLNDDRGLVTVHLERIDLAKRPYLLLLALFLPVMWVRYFTARNLRKLREVVRIDGVELWVDHFRTGWIQLLVGSNVRLIHVSHNCEYEICQIATRQYSSLKRYLFFFEGVKVRFWERRLVSQSDIITCITREDVALFEKHYGSADYHVLAPDYNTALLAHRKHEQSSFTAIIIGSYMWGLKRDNLQAYLASVNVASAPPGFKLLIAGMIPADFAQLVESTYPWVTIRSNFSSLAELQGLGKIGLCIDSVGGGFKMKTLDYMNLGLPILGLDVALFGVPESHGVLRFHSYEQMNHRLFELSGNDELCEQMGRRNVDTLASTFASGHFNSKVKALSDA